MHLSSPGDSRGDVFLEGVAIPGAQSWLLACVEVILARAGRPLTAPVLAGLFGHAFESSWGVGGAEVWSGCCCEWYYHAGGFRRLGLSHVGVDLVGRPQNPGQLPTEEQRQSALCLGRDLVRATLQRGVPALVWNGMSADQRDAGLGAFTWALIEGIQGEDYLVVHPSAGRHRVRFDLLGRCDSVHWFSIQTWEPAGGLTGAPDCRGALEQGARLLAGELRSADQPNARILRQGFEAFDTWAGEVSRSPDDRALMNRTSYWAGARERAAGFCDFARAQLPQAGRELAMAAAAFREQSMHLARLAGGDVKEAAALAARVSQLQRIAHAAVQASASQ